MEFILNSLEIKKNGEQNQEDVWNYVLQEITENTKYMKVKGIIGEGTPSTFYGFWGPSKKILFYFLCFYL